MPWFDAIDIHYSHNILIDIGLILVVVFLGSKLFQRFGIPQVVGFIVIGVVLGESFLGVIPKELIEDLSLVSLIALGLIGFDIGSHLIFKDLRVLGRSIAFILIFEAFGTFALVSLGIFVITNSIHTALIFGALATATAPAATVDVLAEYDAKGPLTTSILAVVGLDDALALLLYSLAAAGADSMLSGTGSPVLLDLLKIPLFEIGGSLILGISMGYLLNEILTRLKKRHDAMAISIGFVVICVGFSEALGLSLILSNMTLGIVLVNLSPLHGRTIRHTIEQVGPVVYILFFALAGARFQIDLLPTMGLIGIAYILLRTIGKFTGAWLGGKLGGAEPAVRNNIGFGLLSQAGVAIGLSIAASARFSNYGEEGIALGTLIISVITATTFLVQIVGPVFVKFAITRADEVGKAKETKDDWASEDIPG